MSKKRKSARLPGPERLAQAMLVRVTQRVATSGTLRVPAVPALLDHYVETCSTLFAAAGRPLGREEAADARALIAAALGQAYAGSPRSKIVVDFHAEAAQPLGYEVRAEVDTLASAYEKWLGSGDAPLFGAHPDARVVSLLTAAPDPASFPVLDLGAGTGRNALALARRGHPVDAVEITPRFAEILTEAAQREGLAVRVIGRNVFDEPGDLRRDYALFVASELVPDFRSTAELRRLFELAAGVLCEGGCLVFNLHLAVRGFTPDRAAREFSQQCYSALFTPSEVAGAAEGLGLELVTNDSVHDYEREHLPPGAWPPTPWYVNWTSGTDVYDVSRDESPVELRWLVYEKRGVAAAAGAAGAPGAEGRTRRFEPALLRAALVRRLQRRTMAAGTLTLPALPALLERYVAMCLEVFAALGRKVGGEELADFRRDLARVLGEAFAASPRSNVVVDYEAPTGVDLRYTVTADPVPLAQAYEDWHEALPDLFGEHPDARVLAALPELGDPRDVPVLDLGAGTGRNALALARRGHAVDAVEITPRFAELLAAAARAERLALRVVAGDVFERGAGLARDYALVLLSGMAGDLRGSEDLRRLLAFAAERMAPAGVLIVNVHVAVAGYEPDAATREWAEQCSATLLTPRELELVLEGLPLELVGNDSAYEYEERHLPSGAWPPTAAYPEWASGTHLFALGRAESPVELRWLVLRRAGARPTVERDS